MVLDQEYPDTLKRMVANGWVTREQEAVYRRIMASEYFPRLLDQWTAFQAEVKEEFDTPVEMKVFTYENDRMEKDTVMSPLDSIKYHRFFLQTGILAVEPTTGHIKVWVGGINHKYFQYDHIRTNRQVGSTFKPFI